LGYLDVYGPIRSLLRNEIRLLATATTDPGELVVMRGGFLSGEVFVDNAAGIIRQVWILGERFQFTFHLRRNRHLTASAERLSRPDPITVVIIPNVFDIA
jgi:hypothetical protein